MATVYRSVGGKKLTKLTATMPGVQGYLRETVFEMQAKAAAELVEHRVDGDATIEVDHGDVDWYLVLSDERGQKAALSIEYGRQASKQEYIDPKTGEKKTRKIGASEGLFILAEATNLPKRKKGKVRLD